MTATPPANAVEQYLYGKDSNRPDLLRHAFTEDAELTMLVRTSTISFPANTQGRHEIAAVLVRNFGLQYENVYTFCLGAPPKPDAIRHRCNWLVGMSIKATGALRVGCGEYDWQFCPHTGLATQLSITIEHMVEGDARHLEAVMDWLQTRRYPWCTPAKMLEAAPVLAFMEPVLAYVHRPLDL